ncbi:MAG TPA: hypothetical protein VHS78_20165 [Candidatus Elarobacter sp.]|jgi:hypothetical protein|nr:hypothetical protein [Candidatus Elarobacter sp.]
MKRTISQLVFAVVVALAMTTRLSVAAPPVPTFQPESISEFKAALQYHVRHSRQALNVNPSEYHAYRFLNPDMVIVGVASAVTVDAQGRLHVIQAHGEPMGGHLNPTHTEYSHVLLPLNVSPPK